VEEDGRMPGPTPRSDDEGIGDKAVAVEGDPGIEPVSGKRELSPESEGSESPPFKMRRRLSELMSHCHAAEKSVTVVQCSLNNALSSLACL